MTLRDMRVLVVDDSVVVRRLVSQALELDPALRRRVGEPFAAELRGWLDLTPARAGSRRLARFARG